MGLQSKRKRAASKARRGPGGRFEKAPTENSDELLEMPLGPTIEQEDAELLGMTRNELMATASRLSWKEGADEEFRAHYDGSSRASQYRKLNSMKAALAPTPDGKKQTRIESFFIAHPTEKRINGDDRNDIDSDDDFQNDGAMVSDVHKNIKQ